MNNDTKWLIYLIIVVIVVSVNAFMAGYNYGLSKYQSSVISIENKVDTLLYALGIE